MEKDNFELFTSSIELIESSDDSSIGNRAIIKIKLITEGANSKNLEWTQETMAKVAEKFRGVPFRYDLTGGNEGSHTRDHISSPFYDVGWTYSDERGAFYDPVNKIIWVKGEVTHPDVVAKLKRQTTDGKREINFASMGAMMKPEQTKCSICGKSPFGICEHTRGENYNGKICNMIPTDISKALHVALTNDPADKNAEIADAIFQDMSNSIDSGAKDAPVPVSTAGNIAGTPSSQELKALISELIEAYMSKKNEKKETADNSVEEEKMSKEKEVLKKGEKVEKKVEEETSKEPVKDKKDLKKSEKVETQESEDKKKKSEDEKELEKEAEEHPTLPKEDVKTIVKDHKKEKKETASDDEDEDDDKKKKDKKELPAFIQKNIDKKKEKEETADDSESFKISGAIGTKNNKIETADGDMGIFPGTTQKVETQQGPTPVVAPKVDYAEKYKGKLVSELADTYVKLGKAENSEKAMLVLQDKSIEQLEIYQDAYNGIVVEQKAAPVIVQPKVNYNNNDISADNEFADDVPEYGGAIEQHDPYVEMSDMSPAERTREFGAYGKYDVCFHPQNAAKYRK